MFKLNTKFDAYSLLYLLSHSECDGHTAHMLTQQHLLPPLTSTVKLSLFTHACSSPLSLAARFHGCCANCSHCINNGWTFSGQTLYIFPLISNNGYYIMSVNINTSVILKCSAFVEDLFII